MGQPRGRGEAVDHGAAHLLPHKADAARIGRDLPPWQRQRDLVCERIVFPHGVAGGAHGAADIVGDAVAPDVAKRSGEPTGDCAVAALEEPPQHLRSVPNCRKGRARIGGIVLEEAGRTGDQRGRQREEPEPVFLLDIPCLGHRGPDVEQRGVIGQRRDLVAALGRAHEKLRRHGLVPGMKGQGKLRRKAPVGAEPLAQIGRAEGPEGGIPGGALADCVIRTCRDVPALHDLLQEAIFEQTFPVRARKLGGADGDYATVL